MSRTREALALGGVSATFVAVNAFYAAVHPFWFDEILTVLLSRLPDFETLLRTIPADGQPPLNYLATRWSMAAFGQCELAARLVPLAAFTVATLAVYAAIRRRRSAIFALLGTAMMWSCPKAEMAYTARPYALMLAFTALAIFCWQHAAEEGRRRGFALVGLALCIAGAVSSHFFGAVQVGMPLALGEGVRLWRRKRVDLPMYAAMLTGFAAFVAILPMAGAARRALMMDYYVRNTPMFAYAPHLSGLPRAWASMIPLALLTAPAVVILTAALFLRRRLEFAGVRWHEAAAAGGLVLVVPLLMAFTALTTGYFRSPYASGAVIGFALLAGWFARGRAATAAVVLGLMLLGTMPLGIRAWREAAAPRESRFLAGVAGMEPIVISSAMDFAPLWWYGSTGQRQRIVYLEDASYFGKVRHPISFMPELTLAATGEAVPLKPAPYREFVAAHRRFLVYCGGTPDFEWVQERLAAEGWKMRRVARESRAALWLAEAP